MIIKWQQGTYQQTQGFFGLGFARSFLSTEMAVPRAGEPIARDFPPALWRNYIMARAGKGLSYNGWMEEWRKRGYKGDAP